MTMALQLECKAAAQSTNLWHDHTLSRNIIKACSARIYILHIVELIETQF